MLTTINNKERVFMVTTSNYDRAFCNLSDLNKVVKEINPQAGYFTIHHFWNGSPKKVSKKYLKELFAAHRLTCEFDY